MRILITSGGTRVDIDSVRHIGNMSRGTFGSRIARQIMLEAEGEIDRLTFLCARGSRTPFSTLVDMNEAGSETDKMWDVLELFDFCRPFEDVYDQQEFVTFQDYEERMADLLDQDFDLVILAAAVSDFLVDDPVEGKIRTRDQMRIDLCEAPKIISSVKRALPKCKLVGFKLLVGSTDEELYMEACKSIEKNGCDMVVANDLRDIRANQHRVILVTRSDPDDGGFRGTLFKSDPLDPDFLANMVARASLARLGETS